MKKKSSGKGFTPAEENAIHQEFLDRAERILDTFGPEALIEKARYDHFAKLSDAQIHALVEKDTNDKDTVDAISFAAVKGSGERKAERAAAAKISKVAAKAAAKISKVAEKSAESKRKDIWGNTSEANNTSDFFKEADTSNNSEDQLDTFAQDLKDLSDQGIVTMGGKIMKTAGKLEGSSDKIRNKIAEIYSRVKGKVPEAMQPLLAELKMLSNRSLFRDVINSTNVKEYQQLFTDSKQYKKYKEMVFDSAKKIEAAKILAQTLNQAIKDNELAEVTNWIDDLPSRLSKLFDIRKDLISKAQKQAYTETYAYLEDVRSRPLSIESEPESEPATSLH